MTEREALEMTYWDQADVYRRENVKDPGTRQTRQTETLAISNMRCALSRDRRAHLDTGGGYGGTEGIYTLFCAPDAGVQDGDRLEVSALAGQSFILRAGRPFIYMSHAEVPVREEKRA